MFGAYRRDSFRLDRVIRARSEPNAFDDDRPVYDCNVCGIIICRVETDECPRDESRRKTHRLSNKRYMTLEEAQALRDRQRNQPHDPYSETT